jgi:hypothetical protein
LEQFFLVEKQYFPFSIDCLQLFSKITTNTWYVFQVEYDFKYYKMEMATDVQLLVLSEGKSNILPADVIVPIQPSATS